MSDLQGTRFYALWLGRIVSTYPHKDDYSMWSSYVYAGNMSVILSLFIGKELEILTNQNRHTVETVMIANKSLIKDKNHKEIDWNINFSESKKHARR
mgnify:CR=1 FL=1